MKRSLTKCDCKSKDGYCYSVDWCPYQNNNEKCIYEEEGEKKDG